MANLYLYYDKRQTRKDGRFPLKMALTHKHKTVYSPMDIFLFPDEWSESNKQVVGRADKKFCNVIIKKRMAECTIALQRVLLRDDADSLDAKQVLNMVMRGTDTADTPAVADYVLPVFNEIITLCKKTTTAQCYRASLKSVVEFTGDVDSLRFKDINVSWLKRYQQWLTGDRGMSVNGANVYLRNLRYVFNFALKNRYTSARYPFRDIDMSTTAPDKRYIEYEKFLEWLTYPVTDNRVKYRDLFMLAFYLRGIRPVDLLHARKDQVVDGRLVYSPEKLSGKAKVSVRIEPEAWEIIHKYEGKEYLLDILESRTDYRAFMSHWNKALKAIGEDEYNHHIGQNGKKYYTIKHHGVVPYITIYFSRTLWASYAYNIADIPMDVISQGLGHQSGLRVTNFYVSRGYEKADQANRKLIDQLKKDAEEYGKDRTH